ncbi:hypothetical protein ACQR3P_28530 [Rhodococcus sp. IEGM1300]
MMTRAQQVLDIVEKHGHPVVLVVRDLKIPCACKSELKQESTCATCIQTGYKIDLKKSVAYRKKNAQGTMGDSRKEDAGGATDIRSYAFYLAGQTPVRSGDLIIERIGGDHVVHVVTTTDHHQDGGEVVYSSVFTKRRSL